MENKYVCSVDIGGTKIATAIMEYPADGSVPHPVFEAEVPTEAQEGGESVFQRIEASIKAALEANPDVEVLGVGIGAAGVVDPKTGFHGAAGHMGHIECSAAAGIPCACGRSGHLESVASGTSIGRMYDERFGRVDSSRPSVGRDVNDLCRAGDAKATEVIHDAGFALGASLGSLANILDPEVIVLSGGVIHQGPDWRSQTWKDSVHEGYASQALDPLQDTPILIGSLEGDAPLIGAAEHLLASLK